MDTTRMALELSDELSRLAETNLRQWVSHARWRLGPSFSLNDAEDLVQEVLLGLVAHGAPGFDPTRGSVESYLVFGQIYWKARGWRARPGLPPVELSERLPAPGSLEHAVIADVVTSRALARLSAEDRTAIEMTHVRGLTNEEAAAALGCSRPTFAVRKHRAVGRLRDLLLEEMGTKATAKAVAAQGERP